MYQKVAKHDIAPETSGGARMTSALLNWLACWGYVYSFSVENIWIDIAATSSPWPAAACSFEASKPAEYERQQHDYVLQPRKRYSLSLEAIWSDKRTLTSEKHVFNMFFYKFIQITYKYNVHATSSCRTWRFNAWQCGLHHYCPRAVR